MQYLSIVVALFCLLSCNNRQIAMEYLPPIAYDTLEIICDSVYPNQLIKISILSTPREENINSVDLSAIIIWSKKSKEQYDEFRRDTISSLFQDVQFIDFTGDGIKDVLVENLPDVRSNLTYYLFKIDTLNSFNIKRTKNFETIKNPNYLKEVDVIDNLVMSGSNYTQFYIIQNDSVISFDDDEFFIDWGSQNYIPEKKYKMALKKVILSKNEDK